MGNSVFAFEYIQQFYVYLFKIKIKIDPDSVSGTPQKEDNKFPRLSYYSCSGNRVVVISWMSLYYSLQVILIWHPHE